MTHPPLSQEVARAIQNAQRIVNGLKVDAENDAIISKKWGERALERVSQTLLEADTELRSALSSLSAALDKPAVLTEARITALAVECSEGSGWKADRGCWKAIHRFARAIEREALSSPPGAPAPGWQPIASAPKDGTPFIAWFQKHRLDDDGNSTDEVVGGAQAIVTCKNGVWDEPQWLDAVGAYYFDDWCFADLPTLWQPLPPPPASPTVPAPKEMP